MEKGLPDNPDIERVVLGLVLLNDTVYPRVSAALEPGDFSLEKHRRIFARMHDLYQRRERIDRFTLANELKRQGQLESVDGLAYLVSLDEGMPDLPNVDSYLCILRNKSALRKMIFAAQGLINQCLIEAAAPDQILSEHFVQIEELRLRQQPDDRIRRIEDLESIFACESEPTKYLIEPELPKKALVVLVGASEAGKTTLVCAWARDLLARGHSVLILDRDKNPRERIRDRMERLGITDSGRLHVWDSEQNEQPPQPDDPRIVEWVKRRCEEDGKSPFIIIDSLIGFFDGDEDENNSRDMRRHLNRSRVLNSAGGTVVELHHANKEGKIRGSSDLEPDIDQAFFVNNRDRAGGRQLDVITLKFVKSRYGRSGSLMYFYQGGAMVRDERPQVDDRVDSEKLTTLLRLNPGVTGTRFEELAAKDTITREVARRFLGNGCLPRGGIQRKPLKKGNGFRYYLEVAQ
jgi:hypothetical protein